MCGACGGSPLLQGDDFCQECSKPVDDGVDGVFHEGTTESNPPATHTLPGLSDNGGSTSLAVDNIARSAMSKHRGGIAVPGASDLATTAMIAEEIDLPLQPVDTTILPPSFYAAAKQKDIHACRNAPVFAVNYPFKFLLKGKLRTKLKLVGCLAASPDGSDPGRLLYYSCIMADEEGGWWEEQHDGTATYYETIEQLEANMAKNFPGESSYQQKAAFKRGLPFENDGGY